MIGTDEHLSQAQEAVRNLQAVLLAARRSHSPPEYRMMAEPLLLELQKREQEILQYLSHNELDLASTPR
jgi:hypothetical protein